MHQRERFDPIATWDWRAALNNGSRRTPSRWEPVAGDTIAGLVVDIGELPARYRGQQPTTFLDLKAVGGTLCGEPLETDAWYRVLCGHARLREMINKDSPQLGDLVAVEFFGVRQFKSGLSRAAYRTVVEHQQQRAPRHGHEPEAAAIDSPW